MSPLRCPHCQASLAEPVVFCGACGRRVAAWQPASAAPSESAVPVRASESGARGDDPDATLPIASHRESGVVRDAVDALDDPSASMERVLRPMGPRLIKRAALVLALGLVAAGITALVLKYTAAPVRVPVVVNLDAPVFRYDLPTAENPSRALYKRRRRIAVRPGRNISAPRNAKKSDAPAAEAEGVAPPVDAPAVANPPVENPPVANPAAENLPPVAGPETSVAAGGPAVAATAKESAAPGPIEMPSAEGDESLPPSPEELREEERARNVADGIRFVLRAHRAQVGACYERAFKDEQRSPGGRVTIDFTIDAGGKARSIHTTDNSTGKEMLSKCLEQRIAEWEFPKPPDGEFATSYPFVFSAGA